MAKKSAPVRHSAKGLISVDADRYLVVAGKSGRWSLPGGERNPGESIEDAWLREVTEESGILPDQLTDIEHATVITGPRDNPDHKRPIAEWDIFLAKLAITYEQIPGPVSCEIVEVGRLTMVQMLYRPEVNGLAKLAVRTVALAA